MKHWQDYVLPESGLFPKQYSIQEVLRETSTSSVLLGFDEKEARQVIIKCFRQNVKGSFLREIGAAYDIKNPNLVSCLNTFQRTDGESCLVYEYLSGGNLADYLATVGVFSITQIFYFLQDILKALIHLHAHNRIHCDIKPENIFLRPKPDGEFDYVLGDLGAACFIREAREGHYVVGTPAYIAPERIRNQFFFNSDLYSLGVVTYELATGQRPFVGSVEEITQANLSVHPPFEAIGYQPLRDMLNHLLTKSPQKRLATASTVYMLVCKLNKQYQKNGLQLKTKPLQNSSQDRSNHTGSLQFILNLDSNPQSIHCFIIGNQSLIGIGYADYTDIINPNCPGDVLKTVLNIQAIQATGMAKLVYATPTQIQQLDLESMAINKLIDNLNNPWKFDFHKDKLIFIDDFNVRYADLRMGNEFNFRSPSLVFDPKLCLLGNGDFCLGEGIANEKLVKRDNTGTIMVEWKLDGPLVFMTRVHDSILVMSLSVADKNSYTIWCFHGTEPARKVALPHQIKHISCSETTLYWLTQEAELYSCGTTLQPKKLKQLAINAAKFAVSFDGNLATFLEHSTQNRATVTIVNLREL